ncbi:DUF4351 domain-containing protein [Aromatoleum anaerobium]|uniref:DUF4351 domain-containing protein n=1 Tax=Aromatoleum anaerobium TaxID=182180 RepID=A0ABX1PMN8_9RHOO|nr:DUF4351 domain-containing protein [Aromatoleum anaerobium]MCK0506470.1 DUF4351 domain-containing protein [Aromatoleum anaerobium]
MRPLPFPDAHRQIDWTHEHVFLDQELRQVVRDAELGRRFVDKLVRVTRLGGGEGWVYVHVEVQGSREADFARRMFVYNYRLFDRYDRPVASLAVLADEEAGWRPDQFHVEAFGCETGIRFPVAKLTDHAERLDALLADTNPFALITAAHLLTRQTRQDPATRFQAKRRLVRLLYERDWNKRRILRLFSVLDWMMQLPKALEAKLWQDIEDIEGERKVRYVTSVERLAIERGMQKGMEKGLEQGIVKGEGTILRRLLTRRFGPLPQNVLDRLARADSEQLETWADRVIDAASLDEVFADD